MTKASPPERLVECRTVALQRAWIERALRSGQTLSDASLWLAGVDRPAEVIASLQRDGVAIKRTTKRVVDAADQAHEDLAWCLAVGPEDMLTPWFDHPQKPARIGVYERDEIGTSATLFSLWDGKLWRTAEDREDLAAKSLTPSAWQKGRWRGLTAPAEQTPGRA
jgi:hypothetical protein